MPREDFNDVRPHVQELLRMGRLPGEGADEHAIARFEKQRIRVLRRSTMMLKTHGTTALRSGRALLETNYRPADVGPGLLTLRLDDQETHESVDGTIRLDPWIGDEYGLIEFRTGNCFLICGSQAVVAVDASNLAFVSSVGLEYQEGETIDSPWHTEVDARRFLVLATERRVWCIDERGVIRWLWACSTEQDRWISGEPVAGDGRVRVPLRTAKGDLFVDLAVSDGLPTQA